MKHKLRVGIIFGGRSGEHEVSLMSARSVRSALDPQKYDVVMVGIDKNGRWLTGDVAAALETGSTDLVRPAALLPGPQTPALMELGLDESQPTTLSEVSQLDIVFPVLHGPYGEDGTVQGLLELADLPYIGAGVVGSAVGMDKAIFKAVMQAHGLPIVPWQLALASEWDFSPTEVLSEIESALDYPMFVKPANMGSSVGISKCMDSDELAAGLNEAARYDRRLVVEQGINARELEVSVLGNDKPITSVIGEIMPRRAFYDYAAKYLAEPGSDDESELVIPAELDPDVANEVHRLAIKAFKAIDCAGLARADFLLEKGSGRIFRE